MNALDSYIAPARARSGGWRVLVGLLIIGLCWIAGTVLVLSGWVLVAWLRLGTLNAALADLEAFQQGGTPLNIAVMLATFAGVWLGVAIALRVLHRQAFTTVLAPERRIRWRAFVLGIGLALVFAAPSTLVALAQSAPLRSDLVLGTWVLWLAPLIALIFVQIAAEEMIFRGYLLQQLGRLSRSPLVWALIPSLVFGAMHYDSTLPEKGGLVYVAVTGLMGLTLATLVWRSGSLWPALGLHLGVNTLGLTTVGAEGLMSGTQLWMYPGADLSLMLRYDLVGAAAMFAVVLSPLGRVFGTGRGGPSPEEEIFR